MLTLKNIHKSFGSNRVLTGVDFELRAGEIHVLFGENGAGKSTLLNIATGMLQPDMGTIELHGRSYSALDPSMARGLGIATVFQEFSLVPQMTITENLHLGREISRSTVLCQSAMKRNTERILRELNFPLEPGALVASLSRAEQQMVEIAKALMTEASIVIFDEPTASLTDSEANYVLSTVQALAARGLGIIYISHRMREIRAIADRVTVLRSGNVVGTVEAASVTEDLLVEMMTGQRIEAFYPVVPHAPAARRLELRNVNTKGVLKDISITVHAGEIVGLSGLVGCGKGEIGRAVFGLEKITDGQVLLNGEVQEAASPRTMMQRGVCYFPADRNTEGLGLNLSIADNVTVASLDVPKYANRIGRVDTRAQREIAGDAMKRLKLRPYDLDATAQSLSGGNRQKVMLGRGLMRDLDVFIFDEPTVGIDVGAKVEVYDFLVDLVERGAAVLLISSELLEVTSLCNRIYVVHHGRVINELIGEQCTQENVLSSFFDKPESSHQQPRVLQ